MYIPVRIPSAGCSTSFPSLTQLMPGRLPVALLSLADLFDSSARRTHPPIPYSRTPRGRHQFACLSSHSDGNPTSSLPRTKSCSHPYDCCCWFSQNVENRAGTTPVSYTPLFQTRQGKFLGFSGSQLSSSPGRTTTNEAISPRLWNWAIVSGFQHCGSSTIFKIHNTLVAQRLPLVRLFDLPVQPLDIQLHYWDSDDCGSWVLHICVSLCVMYIASGFTSSNWLQA